MLDQFSPPRCCVDQRGLLFFLTPLKRARELSSGVPGALTFPLSCMVLRCFRWNAWSRSGVSSVRSATFIVNGAAGLSKLRRSGMAVGDLGPKIDGLRQDAPDHAVPTELGCLGLTIAGRQLFCADVTLCPATFHLAAVGAGAQFPLGRLAGFGQNKAQAQAFLFGSNS